MSDTQSGNSRHDNRIVPITDGEAGIATAITENGQPLALTEDLTTGSKSWGDLERDKSESDEQWNFPLCSTARTTFYANDKEYDVENEERYERLFPLQHGRQHPLEPRIEGYSEGWGGQKVRQESVDKYHRARIILSRVKVTGSIRKWTLQKVMSKDLRGFNRYYEGIDGAAIGFATLYKYDNSDQAKDSYLVDEAEALLDVDGEMLIDYVWREYGGDHQ